MEYTIGKRLKDLRERAGLSLEQASSTITAIMTHAFDVSESKRQLSKQNLYKYENGIITNIPSDMIERLASLYGTSPSYIMGWTDDIEPENNKKESGHFTNAETAKLAQEAYDDPDVRILLKAKKKAAPEVIRGIMDTLKALSDDD